MRTILLCSTILAATLAAAQNSGPVNAFDQQMIDHEKQFLQAAETRNASAVDTAIAEDFQGIGTNGDFYDRSEIVDSAHEAKPQETRAYDFRVVKLGSDSAIVAYNLILPGEKLRYRHMSDTWVRIDGQWKLKFRQITANMWSAIDLD